MIDPLSFASGAVATVAVPVTVTAIMATPDLTFREYGFVGAFLVGIALFFWKGWWPRYIEEQKRRDDEQKERDTRRDQLLAEMQKSRDELLKQQLELAQTRLDKSSAEHKGDIMKITSDFTHSLGDLAKEMKDSNKIAETQFEKLHASIEMMKRDSK